MLRVYIAAAVVIAALGVIAVAQERKIAALSAEKETLSANLAAARDSLRKSDEAAKELSRTIQQLRSKAVKTEDKINARITEKAQSDPCLNSHIDRGLYLWLRGSDPERDTGGSR
jgi:septal ring factor EnvC (AmiA/AmiB activator)